jgi:hypothetical protein
MNSYSYAANNPLIYIDPLGLWNEKTGAVEKGDTLTSITNQENKMYNTNYSVQDIAKLNSIKNPDKIYVGQIVKPNEKSPDVSNDLTPIGKPPALAGATKKALSFTFSALNIV